MRSRSDDLSCFTSLANMSVHSALMNIRYPIVSHKRTTIHLRVWKLSGDWSSRLLTMVRHTFILRYVQSAHHAHYLALAEPLTEEEVARKEELVRHGFDNWSKRDFQQFVKAVEAHGRCAPITSLLRLDCLLTLSIGMHRTSY